MRFLRCGCGLFSLLSLLPILILLVVGLAVLNDPHILPGAVGDLAASARKTVASFVLGRELDASKLTLGSVDLDAKNGGTMTVTLETKANKAPALSALAPALKAVGGHLGGLLALSADPLKTIVIVVNRASDETTLLTLHVAVADLRAYVDGKLTTDVFLKKVASTP